MDSGRWGFGGEEEINDGDDETEVVFGFVWFILIRVGFGWVINAGLVVMALAFVCLVRLSI
jgi:hypothetical protein